jgi:hypothetical protein
MKTAMMCNHNISDQDIAMIADGLCPLCLQAEIERLRAALEPFADYAPPLPSEMPDDFRITLGSDTAKRQLTIGDCRRAARALGETKAAA